MRNSVAMVGMAGLLLAQPVSVSAQWPVIDVAAIAQLLLMKAEEIKQYADMVKNSGRFLNLPWADIRKYLDSTQKALDLGQSIAGMTQDAESIFRKRFPGYAKLKIPYQQAYQDWNKTAFDTMAAVLKSANKHREGMADETAIINNLSDSVMSATGRMQAAQTTARLAGHAATQLIELREIIIADAASRSAYQAAMLQKDATAESAAAAFFAWQRTQDTGNARWSYKGRQ